MCRAHGGAAPQVQRKAQERIAHASDVAVMKLLALMQDPDVPKAVKAAVARDLLDRANVTGKTTVEIEVPLWQQVLDGIVATVPTDGETPMRAFAEGQPALDPLVIQAERADQERELARYQTEPHDEDYSDPWAYGSEPPRPAPAQEPAMPTVNGDDRPPPRHPLPERRRIEPDDPDYWAVPRTYTPTPRRTPRGEAPR